MNSIRLGLIGDNIAQSRSPQLHRLAGEICGVDVTYELLIPSERGMSFDQLFAACRDDGFRGINVTYPYKELVFRKVVAPTPVQRIGACNTVLFGEVSAGDNTDYSGFRRAFRAWFGARQPGRVAMAGAGGVGKAIAFALADLGASALTIFDDDRDKAERLSAAVAAAAPGIAAHAAASVAEAMDGAEGFVNATPLGMYGRPGSAMPGHLLPSEGWAFDAVYTPVDTEFLTAARRAGLEVMSGFELFLYQGIDAFSIFTGRQPDPNEVRRALTGSATGAAVA